MSSFLSTPVVYARQQAQDQGLTFLSHAKYVEVAAALFGYEQYRLMKPQLIGLWHAIQRPNSAVIYAESAAVWRCRQLLAGEGAPAGVAEQYVSLLIRNLAGVIPGRSYLNEGQFWEDHLDPYITEHFLSQLELDPDVARVHDKVRAPCRIVEVEDVDNEDYVWASHHTWRVWVMAGIYAIRPDGQPDRGGEYLLANFAAAYPKLDRAVVSAPPTLLRVSANANRYHAGMGGEPIR